MKRKLIEKSQDSLITCDNPKCDFTIPYAQEEEKYLFFYVDMPCPICGENLCTIEDYLLHEKLIRGVNWINKWFSWMAYLIPKKSYDNSKTLSVHVHDGIKIKEEIN